jgi:phage gp46-like protein
MGDILLFDTIDGGEIEVRSGRVTIDRDGLRTAAYISLFGGNERDEGISATDHLQWWGNRLGPPTSSLRSRTQSLLRGLPATSANLVRVEDAARQDLAWMTGEFTGEAEISASMPEPGRLRLTIDVPVTDEERVRLVFERPWGEQ